ncbi:MAG TPA: glycosyltransferase [bacterium]|nr:glycosyltransferase [bacterium]
MGKISVGFFTQTNLALLGGGERLALELVNHLKTSFDVDLFHNPLNDNYSVAELKKYSEFADIEPKEVTYQGFPWPINTLYRPLPPPSSLTYDVNLIMVYRPPPPSYLKNIMSTKAKVAFLLHGIGLDRVIQGNLKYTIYQVLMRRALKAAANIAKKSNNIFFQTLNNTQYNYLSSVLRNTSKIFLIENGVHFEKYRVGLNTEHFRVIFIGRMSDRDKGIRRLRKVILHTAQINPEIQFLIAGRGPDSALVTTIPTKNYRYLGYITEEQKIRALESSNLILSTSNLEPFPLVLLEGLASGLPIISTPTSGPKHIIGYSKAFGNLTSWDPAEIAKNILNKYKQWNESINEYNQQKTMIRETAEKHFDWKRMAEKYSTMIKVIHQYSK